MRGDSRAMSDSAGSSRGQPRKWSISESIAEAGPHPGAAGSNRGESATPTSSPSGCSLKIPSGARSSTSLPRGSLGSFASMASARGRRCQSIGNLSKVVPAEPLGELCSKKTSSSFTGPLGLRRQSSSRGRQRRFSEDVRSSSVNQRTLIRLTSSDRTEPRSRLSTGYTECMSAASASARSDELIADGVDLNKSQTQRSGLSSSSYRANGWNLSQAAQVEVRSRFSWCQSIRRWATPRCRAVNKNKFFQAAMFMALLAALFLPDLWILLDRPGNKDLDVILWFVLAMFLFELVVQSIGLTRTYLGSFFFWMDLLGAVSLLLDLSIIPISSGGGDSVSNNAVIMRAARIAKLGARAGRFTKLVKLLRFLPGMREKGVDQGTAKVISARLTTALSTRVSCLIIVMVVVMPFFSMWTYPEQDWSMKSWLDVLEKTSARHPERFARQLEKLGNFYSDMDYYPFKLEVKGGQAMHANVTDLLPWTSLRGPPKRAANTIRHESSNFACEFNFKKPNQIDSLMNVLLLWVVMVLMVGFSLVLSNSVSAIVLRPLEKLLMQVRKMASTIFQSVTDMACTMREVTEDQNQEHDEDDGGQTGSAFGNETELLEKVVQKLAVLSEITMNKSVIDAETMEGLGEGDRAVIHGFQGSTRHGTAWKDVDSDDEMQEDTNYENMLNAQRTMVENAGLSLDLLNSWNLNPLELDKARNHAAAMYFVGPHNHGVSFDAVVMAYFLECAESSYLKTCAYHNWFHAIDVTHCVYRSLRICTAEAYLSNTERYGLLVSAVCHDVGHPGLNNTFLVEASHELALRYNDKSPLENMHCAKLFELISVPRCNIFGSLPKAQFQEVRKICIEAILHTDNTQHFVMIKEVQMIYEVNSEILDASRELYNEDPIEFPTEEAVDCFRQPESRKLLVKLFLHFADISNSMKPFRICRIWAAQVLEECFLQGDAEKKLGVPVQALNDREKVNRAFSQVGFIEFLVSPLLFAVIKVLPPTIPHMEQMIQNVKSWHQHWQTDTKPAPSEQERKALADRVTKLEQRYLECL